MALIKCSECGKEISDTASKCIHCGCPIEKKKICEECGKEINSNDKICKNCGAKVKKNFVNNIIKNFSKSDKIKGYINQSNKKIYIIIGISILTIIIILFTMSNLLKPNIIGTWEWKYEDNFFGNDVYTTYTFKKGNKCEIKGELNKYDIFDSKTMSEVECKYKFNFWGNKIKITTYKDGKLQTKDSEWENFEKNGNKIYIDNKEYTSK